VLRSALHEDRQFRRQQLRDIARSPVQVITTGSAAELAAHGEVRRKLRTAARTALAETEAALARMDTGRYGRCGRCGSMISFERLSAHPQARHCARCQLFVELLS
jgi:RNA polymerase-binding transcription factor DksA